ncbi:uncharacterized protein LOC9655236 [Selaginella moellendorffii]|uniref:uncharacterized protein LOC9655236 n=1 Tax=Selaginella moellendorffii TaxID=88036 RepID=UPI000D1CEC2A|nr:uncharacterized protein LOC9655236 [Selaginella moellendorffii]|eukprot:XP_024524232.1 uncharacterized protein LOC9655236 [Selaginella moellendorffii]
MARIAHGGAAAIVLAANRPGMIGLLRMRGLGSSSCLGGGSSRGFLRSALQKPRSRDRAGEAAWRRFCIQEQLNAQEVTVKDAYGDGRHVSIEVVAEVFEGQSQVNRQRMVYKAIWEELQNAVHAVDQLKTKTPAEAKS